MINSSKFIKLILFLPGKYNFGNIDFYKTICRGKIRIAVDGGYRFFQKTSVRCDYLIGDFDSLKTKSKDIPSGCKIIKYPVDKDKTDTQLALEFCFKQQTTPESIDIIQPSIGEIDHFIGNLFLLTMPSFMKQKDNQINIRILNRDCEIIFVSNDYIKIKGKRGELISIIPLSNKIELSTKGCSYNVNNLSICRGETKPLRNRIMGNVAEIKISGEVFIYHKFHK